MGFFVFAVEFCKWRRCWQLRAFGERENSRAENGFTSGRVYDALLLGCAAKAKAETIYTWNLLHFQAIAPEFANRMRTP